MICLVDCGCDGARVAGCAELMRNCGRGVVCGRGVLLLVAVAKSCCCCEAGMVGAESESSHRRSKVAKVDECDWGRSGLDYQFCKHSVKEVKRRRLTSAEMAPNHRGHEGRHLFADFF